MSHSRRRRRHGILGIAGFPVGDIIAWQLAYPALNFDLEPDSGL